MTQPPVQLPPADLGRRFYAFVVDRIVAWTLYAGGAWLAWWLYWRDGLVWEGIGVLVGVVVVVALVLAVTLGLTGLSPGRAATGLRLVGEASGAPIGVVPAILRGLVLGVATLPTFGFGVATLAWTALTDADRRRRGWHDRLAGSIVVDVRPQPDADAAQADEAPRRMVNLTAMRLVPAGSATPVAAPQRIGATPDPAPEPTPTPTPTPSPVESAPPPAPPAPPAQPDQRLGGPLRPGGGAADRRGRHRGRGPGGSAARTSIRPVATGGHGWRVTFDSGETLVVEGLALVGRKPEPRSGERVRHVIALPSTDMSLSKTHAQVHLSDGVLVVMDRGSTNGSVLNRRGVARDLLAGRPATLVDGDRVRFGDREMRVEKQA